MPELQRLIATVTTSAQSGFLRLEADLLALDLKAVRNVDGIPDEVNRELVPRNLRSIGSRFVIVFAANGPVVAVERIGGRELPGRNKGVIYFFAFLFIAGLAITSLPLMNGEIGMIWLTWLGPIFIIFGLAFLCNELRRPKRG
jgi:hypothetical protein